MENYTCNHQRDDAEQFPVYHIKKNVYSLHIPLEASRECYSMEENDKMAKKYGPKKFPCFVIRCIWGGYFIMPVNFVLPGEVDLQDISVGRTYVVPKKWEGFPNNPPARILFLLFLDHDSIFCALNVPVCLAVAPDRSFYMHEYFKTTETNEAPWNTHWMNLPEFTYFLRQKGKDGKLAIELYSSCDVTDMVG